MVEKKTRFAPSPTGYMHIGNARTALFSYLAGNRFILRIEDTDLQRSQPQFVDALIEDLQWLGITWQEGPGFPDGEQYVQSRRSGIYRDCLQQLVHADRAYPCFCSTDELARTRARQLAMGRPPRYAGTCSHLSREDIADRIGRGEQPSYRFRVDADDIVRFDDLVRGEQIFHGRDIGDFVIQRSDDSAAFFFSNAIDDAMMGVDLVVRGEDHLSNTPRQLMLLSALSLRQPQYAHIALILGDDGTPLSKRNGSQSIRELRESGFFPLAVINALARIGHHYQDDRLLDWQALVAGFSMTNLSHSPARHDMQHLLHWQHSCMKSMDSQSIFTALPAIIQHELPVSLREDFIEIVRYNCLFPADAMIWFDVLTRSVPDMQEDARAMIRQCIPEWFNAVAAAIATTTDYKSFIETIKTTGGYQGKSLFMPLRAMLSGRLDGPELARIFAMLSPGQLSERLEYCRALSGENHENL
ncbi:MAG: hypothetical protein RIQ52_151 [Pseudomonadota bacterium]|jgi:glutamyl-tRNA synthetase